MSAGFAVALSGVGAAGALAGSLVVGSFLLGGSSSRVLRASFLFRAVAAVCCAAAIPANPLAPALLLVGSALFNGAGNAGALATTSACTVSPRRRLVSTARAGSSARPPAPQARGPSSAPTALALAPPAAWAVYTALYAGSAISRTIATFEPRSPPRGVARPPLP